MFLVDTLYLTSSIFIEFWFILCFLSFKVSLPTIAFFDSFLTNHITPNPLALLINLSDVHPPILLLTNVLIITSLPYYQFLYLIVIILGSFWAYNEFNWGGFWSFDFVEVYGVALFFIFCFNFHLSFLTKFNSSINIYVVFLLIGFLKFFPVPSIHSFLTSPKSFYFILLIVFYNPVLSNFYWITATTLITYSLFFHISPLMLCFVPIQLFYSFLNSHNLLTYILILPIIQSFVTNIQPCPSNIINQVNHFFCNTDGLFTQSIFFHSLAFSSFSPTPKSTIVNSILVSQHNVSYV